MEKVVREKLWTHSFCAVAAGNFLLFFCFLFVVACFAHVFERSVRSKPFDGRIHIVFLYHHGADDTSVRRVYGRYLSP